MRSGFFITMAISVPPCKTDPSIRDIKASYGEPDFVQTSAERKKKGAGDVEKDVITYYYDYFGFEVDPKDKEQRVIRVVAQADDFSQLQDTEIDNCFGRVAMQNLTVFYQKKKEVGRLYFFREGEKETIVINEPPPGIYSRDGIELEYLGGGKWVEQSKYKNGKIASISPYLDHRMEGKGKGFHRNGKVRYTAEYRKGQLHGEVVEFSEDGKEVRRRKFINGEADGE